mgnify:CR=1 FL=1
MTALATPSRLLHAADRQRRIEHRVTVDPDRPGANLRGESVRISGAGAERVGVAAGIDAHGSLQLLTAEGAQIGITAGEVSVRRSGSS